MNKRAISDAVIHRLPRYYRYLIDLDDDGVIRISSEELGKIMGVTASQIRQDFNNFGGFGQQGYGYNVKYLKEQIGKIVGLDAEYNMVIIGGGNFGRTLTKFFNEAASESESNYKVTAIFDSDPEKIGQDYRGIRISDVNELSDFVKDNKVDIAILTVPKTSAAEAAGAIINAGITAIWNYTQVDLDVPEDVLVENVHLFDSLMRLSFSIKNSKKD